MLWRSGKGLEGNGVCIMERSWIGDVRGVRISFLWVGYIVIWGYDKDLFIFVTEGYVYVYCFIGKDVFVYCLYYF